jgi:hypothetical protein
MLSTLTRMRGRILYLLYASSLSCRLQILQLQDSIMITCVDLRHKIHGALVEIISIHLWELCVPELLQVLNGMDLRVPGLAAICHLEC